MSVLVIMMVVAMTVVIAIIMIMSRRRLIGFGVQPAAGVSAGVCRIKS